MSHFAEVDENATVVRVVVVHNDVITVDGVENEQRGIDFLNDLFPASGEWVQTSYNNRFRTRYAVTGSTYDADRDAFIGLQPFPSWTLNDADEWEAPTPAVAHYQWDEATLAWVLPPSPFPSWVWSEGPDGMVWLPPVPYPGASLDEAPFYEWDEATTSWIESPDA
jgi:hypothetical protein